MQIVEIPQIQVELQGVFGNDRWIAEAAWTSSTTNEKKSSRTDEDVKRIVNMLADSKHSVPFESVVLRFWFKLPITTDRQFMTHRLQSASGLSGRYRTMPNEYQEVASDVASILTKISQETCDSISTEYNKLCESAFKHYNDSLAEFKKARDSGVITGDEYKRLREFLRGELPQNAMTERVTTMNLRSFANFVKLRHKTEAQVEIRYLSDLMLQAVKNSNTCPHAIEALERNQWQI